MSNGEFAARKMMKDKKVWRKKSAKYIKKWKRDNNKLKDPLKGAPMRSGIVLAKRTVEAKQPNSGLRKCVRVQLSTGIKVTALAPKDGAIKYIDQHDQVTLSGINGSKGGSKGDLWGVSYKVEKVNNISLEMLRKGKKEKSKR